MRSILLSAAFMATAYGFPAQIPKTPVSQELYDLFYRQSNIQAASVPIPCNIPPYGMSAVRYFNNTVSDTQANLFRDDARKEFTLAFPGTMSPEDILFDINIELLPFASRGIDLLHSCFGCAVHTGFLVTWNSVADDIIDTLNTSLASYPTYTITVSGHSLGAGIGSLAYASLKGVGLPVTQLFTFGQPRSGNLIFANYIDKISGANQDPNRPGGEVYRLTHAYDIITRIPFRLSGYWHHSIEYYQMNISADATGTVSPQSTFRCYGQEPTDCINSLGLAFTDLAHGFYTNVNVGGSDKTVCNRVIV